MAATAAIAAAAAAATAATSRAHIGSGIRGIRTWILAHCNIHQCCHIPINVPSKWLRLSHLFQQLPLFSGAKPVRLLDKVFSDR